MLLIRINNNFSTITIKYTTQYKSYSNIISEDKYEMTKMKNQRSCRIHALLLIFMILIDNHMNQLS